MSYESDGRGVAAVLGVSLQKMLFVLVGRCTEKRGVRVLLVGKKKTAFHRVVVAGSV